MESLPEGISHALGVQPMSVGGYKGQKQVQGGLGQDTGARLQTDHSFDKTYLEEALPAIFRVYRPRLHHQVERYELQSISDLSSDRQPLSVSLGDQEFTYGGQDANPQASKPIDMVVVAKMKGPFKNEVPINTLNFLNLLTSDPDEKLRIPARSHVEKIRMNEVAAERHRLRYKGFRGRVRSFFGK